VDLEPVKEYIATYGYLAVALGTLWDQSGLQAFVIAGGIMASVTGKSGGANLSVWGVAAAGAVGSFASDAVLFGVGRWRAAWLERVMKSEKNRMRMVVLQEGVRKWGFWLLAFGRFLPWMGRFVPAAAGLRRYPAGKAMLFAAAGSAASGFAFAALGYYAAESLQWFEEYALYVGIGALAISIPAAWLLLKRFDAMVERRMTAEQAVVEGDVKLTADIKAPGPGSMPAEAKR
jgi:membrane protein DedA with SNARE-associated domain